MSGRSASAPFHIVHVIPLIALGGVWRHLQTLCRTDRIRFRHTVISLFKTEGDDIDDLRPTALVRLALSSHTYTDKNFISTTLLNAFQSMSPNLIHSHHYSADLFALPAARQFRIPAVRTVHGITQAGASDALHRAGPRLDWSSKQICDELSLEGPTVQTLTVCRSLRERLLSYGFAPDRVSTLYLGIDPVEVRATARAPRSTCRRSPRNRVIVGFAGRLEPIKNPSMMCHLAMMLRDRTERVEIRIVGSGSLLPNLRQEIHNGGLEGLVAIRPGGPGMRAEIAQFDILVIPSLLEGVPLVALEAMAFCVPVVASAVGGIPELITHDHDGLLFRSEDVADLCIKIAPLLESRERRERLGRCGFTNVQKRFSLHRQLEQLEQTYLRSLSSLPLKWLAKVPSAGQGIRGD